jgi:hypothetical protein
VDGGVRRYSCGKRFQDDRRGFRMIEEEIERQKDREKARLRPDTFGEKELLTRLEKQSPPPISQKFRNWQRRLFLARNLAQVKRCNGQ